MVALCSEAVFVGRPRDSVDDALPLVRERARLDVVTSFRLLACIRDTVLEDLDAIGRLVPVCGREGGWGEMETERGTQIHE